MSDLIEKCNYWSAKGRLLQPYYVKPLLRELAKELEKLRNE